MASTDRRTIKAYATDKPGLIVEPFEYVSRPLEAEDVEIAISHSGICGSDLHIISDGWGGANYPIVPGHEIVGHVTAVGPDVKHLKIGDRVGVGAMVSASLDEENCKQCAADNDAYCDKALGTYNGKYPDGEKD